jgi:hypothetical protein
MLELMVRCELGPQCFDMPLGIRWVLRHHLEASFRMEEKQRKTYDSNSYRLSSYSGLWIVGNGHRKSKGNFRFPSNP